MTAQNKLLAAPPYPVEEAVIRLGANLRTARLRRNLTISDVAAKIGAGPRAVRNAEKGKPSTSIGVFAALLWVLDLIDHLDTVADPSRDERGQRLAMSQERKRARQIRVVDNDF